MTLISRNRLAPFLELLGKWRFAFMAPLYDATPSMTLSTLAATTGGFIRSQDKQDALDRGLSATQFAQLNEMPLRHLNFFLLSAAGALIRSTLVVAFIVGR